MTPAEQIYFELCKEAHDLKITEGWETEKVLVETKDSVGFVIKDREDLPVLWEIEEGFHVIPLPSTDNLLEWLPVGTKLKIYINTDKTKYYMTHYKTQTEISSIPSIALLKLAIWVRKNRS